jgi:hypothetical protein
MQRRLGVPFGIHITTLDNPGWTDIDITETEPMAGNRLQIQKKKKEDDWSGVSVKK